jgi:uncharacterized glyoxalase superfamily protein PhnB
MKLAATVIYVDDVGAVVSFYGRALGLEPKLLDLDVQLPGREAGGRYEYAILDTEGGSLQFGSHELGRLLMPPYARSASGQAAGVEVAFYTNDVAAAYRRAVEAGAEALADPKVMPWGQTVAYVRSVEGTLLGICSPLPE